MEAPWTWACSSRKPPGNRRSEWSYCQWKRQWTQRICIWYTGDYQVNIHENIVIEPGSSYLHNTCPWYDPILLHVSSMCIFLFHSEITFSDSLRVGVGAEDRIMLVPVTIERYNKYLPIEIQCHRSKNSRCGNWNCCRELDSQTQLREGKTGPDLSAGRKRHRSQHTSCLIL